MITIMKLQRPLDDDSHPILAYNQNRSIQKTIDMDERLRRLFADRVKIYVEARIRGDRMDILSLVPDRPW